MRIYKYIHSCLLIEEGDDKILFDPGIFSFKEGKVDPETFKDVSTVIITHQHPDHVDIPALKKILQNSKASVITNTEGKTSLEKEGIEASVLEEGNYQTKNFTIRALPAAHEKILSSTLPQNTAYVLNDTFLNPGDSFASDLSTLKGIKALALAVMAPWNTELGVAQFARMIAPQMVIPVHDGYAKDFFLKQRYDNYEQYFSPLGIQFQRMYEPGDVVEVS
ncbi:MAG: MBL fold metallo-hydrolase [Chloroflexota bacterium]|nr:MBL fold metallo-hydrolase [Chloroflexota bacterium]